MDLVLFYALTGVEGAENRKEGSMPLTLAGTGVPLVIQRIGGNAELKQHLSDLGFVVGGEVTVISTSLGNVIVKIKDSRVAISKEMANKIMV